MDSQNNEIILQPKLPIYINNISDLYEKYKDDEYMKQRVHYHIMNLLPNALDNECKNHEKRIIRNDYLTHEHQQFIQVFLSENQYFYLPNNNCFYFYDGKNYWPIKEDIIHHQLLTTISKDKKLMQWKYRTKINVIKQIKDRHLFKSIPDSDTIQNVLSILHPSIFSDKNQAKYFLTILGDNILKKNSDLIFLIKPKAKKFLFDIENMSYIYTGFTNLTHNIVTKYHENYNYNNCRLLKMSHTLSIDIWKNMLSKYGIDLICVATHYSQRFENSDFFINNFINDEHLKSYLLFLKNNTQISIIDKFCKHSIQTSQPSCNDVDQESNKDLIENNSNSNSKSNSKLYISWKNMHYIWKLYISKFSLPSAIYLTPLKEFLKERYSYDETTDTFNNVTSKYLPCVGDFIQFWEKTISSSTSNSDSNSDSNNDSNSNSNSDSNDINNDSNNDNEFEIDEICILFKKWTQENSNISLSNGNIAETEVLKILNHFFPSIKVSNSKYILGITCNMWDKNTSIYDSLLLLKEKYNTKSIFEENHTLIAFDEAYDFYFQKNKPISKFIVSKRYFEKYLYSTLFNYIEYEKFISSSCYLS